jgi:hypothetical protein|tara:strand:+ start:190 stop:420 length:231 start_codon:yes stop_codon:yes gene_type:complete
MRTLEQYKKLQEMKKLIGGKIKFITSYMPKGDFDIMTLDKIETNGSEFNEPYFSTKDDSRFCTLDYAKERLINGKL